MLVIEVAGPGRFQVTFTDRALAVLTERCRCDPSPEIEAEYGPVTIPAPEVLRMAIREGLDLSAEDAADDPDADLNDGVPF